MYSIILVLVVSSKAYPKRIKLSSDGSSLFSKDKVVLGLEISSSEMEGILRYFVVLITSIITFSTNFCRNDFIDYLPRHTGIKHDKK